MSDFKLLCRTLETSGYGAGICWDRGRGGCRKEGLNGIVHSYLELTDLGYTQRP